MSAVLLQVSASTTASVRMEKTAPNRSVRDDETMRSHLGVGPIDSQLKIPKDGNASSTLTGSDKA